MLSDSKLSKKDKFMRVLLINTSERIGGAAVAASRLMESLKNKLGVANLEHLLSREGLYK